MAGVRTRSKRAQEKIVSPKETKEAKRARELIIEKYGVPQSEKLISDIQAAIQAPLAKQPPPPPSPKGAIKILKRQKLSPYDPGSWLPYRPARGELKTVGAGRNKSKQINIAPLKALGYEIGQALGEPGTNATTYLACLDKAKCHKVIKLGHVEELETIINSFAGELGFAPKVYDMYDLGNDVTALILERMGDRLDDLLKRGECTVDDADKIATLVRNFNAAHFMHHDLKPDNIMTVLNSNPRQWRLIDFGFSWYGGPRYNPKHLPDGIMNCPYAYTPVSIIDETGRVDPPHMGSPGVIWEPYNGWPWVVPECPSLDWDLACLAWAVLHWHPQELFKQKDDDVTQWVIAGQMGSTYKRGFHLQLMKNLLSTGNVTLYRPIDSHQFHITLPLPVTHKKALPNANPQDGPDIAAGAILPDLLKPENRKYLK